MGIFDFVKDAGEAIFGDDDETVEEPAPEINHAREAFLKQQENEQFANQLSRKLAGFGLMVDDLELNMHEGICTISGTVQSQKDHEQIVLALGNTQGVERVNSSIVVEVPEPEATFYTVQKGDNLSKIAKAHYGESNKYRQIFEANQPLLSDPDKIYPGQVLRIPDLDAVA